VLYLDSLAGIPWVGLISVDENPTGGDAQPFYMDGVKYLNVSADEEFEATIKAYTYPVEFSQCDGTARIRNGLFFGQQRRKSFGFSYRTLIGNDTEGAGLGYKIHLVYNALATPATRSATTFTDSIEAADFSWSITTKNPSIPGQQATSHIIIDSRYTESYTMEAVEALVYGSDTDVARLPTAQELIDIFDTPLDFTVTALGGELYRIAGPNDKVRGIGLGKYLIDNSTVVSVDGDTYTISS
jgi:hypothetical protein